MSNYIHAGSDYIGGMMMKLSKHVLLQVHIAIDKLHYYRLTSTKISILILRC